MAVLVPGAFKKLIAGSADAGSSCLLIAATSWSKSLVSYWWLGVLNCGTPFT
jgi:hypothetical protein